MTIATRIKATRKARGMNMSALANICGVTPTAVSNWEAGNTIPRDENLEVIARSLGVTVQYLKTGRTIETEALDVLSILDRAKQQLVATLGVPPEKINFHLKIEP